MVLGPALVAAGSGGGILALLLGLLAGPVPDWPLCLIALAGTYVLLPVGALDDRARGEERGLREHVTSLLSGRTTTGILKLAAGVAVAALAALQIDGGVTRVLLATSVIALTVNVTNALDVRPGRALKWALVAMLPVALAAWGQGVILVLASYLGASAVALVFDLTERGMLGDAGSNPLGLVVGTGLAAVLPVPGLAVALVALLGLQVAAETVTISRVIEAVPPLRWFDRLGRRS